MIDTHIHLSHHLFDNEFPYLSFDGNDYDIQRGIRDQLICEFMSAGIEICIEPAIDICSNHILLQLSEKYPNFLYAAIGVHPTRTYQYRTVDKDGKPTEKRLQWKERRTLDTYTDHPNVVAIGELGLDYHLDRSEQHRFWQKIWFIYQIKLAERKKLPLILHIREADKDAIRILKHYKSCLHGGVCHCFGGNSELASMYTDLGLSLGIGGTLLMNIPEKYELEQAVIETPLEYLLLETDSPYVKPYCPDIPKKQLRKVRNTSLIIPAVAQRIAELKGISYDEVLKCTSENAKRLFGIDKR